MNLQERWLGSLWGAVVGDALGVPVEFRARDTLQQNPVVGMLGYGTHHQPPGTWSDDSSLMLCTVASLTECNGLDLDDLANRFVAWRYENYMTPHGQVFDIGNATAAAIQRLKRRLSPILAGGTDEGSNGNGSLMRVLPIGIYFAKAPLQELLDAAHQVSALTHRHPRSQIACGIYCLVIAGLLAGQTRMDAYESAIEKASGYYAPEPAFSSELRQFERFMSGKIPRLLEDDVASCGYVVDTLEASLWCLTTTNTFQEAVLRAVNLGGDTDTTGTVTGGLAGLVYGLDHIPTEWRSVLAQAAEIESLFQSFVRKMQA